MRPSQARETADNWEDVVEVSLLADAAPVRLLAWAGEQSIEVDPGQYRVRYCASGMDIGREADTRLGHGMVAFTVPGMADFSKRQPLS